MGGGCTLIAWERNNLLFKAAYLYEGVATCSCLVEAQKREVSLWGAVPEEIKKLLVHQWCHDWIADGQRLAEIVETVGAFIFRCWITNRIWPVWQCSEVRSTLKIVFQIAHRSASSKKPPMSEVLANAALQRKNDFHSIYEVNMYINRNKIFAKFHPLVVKNHVEHGVKNLKGKSISI